MASEGASAGDLPVWQELERPNVHKITISVGVNGSLHVWDPLGRQIVLLLLFCFLRNIRYSRRNCYAEPVPHNGEHCWVLRENPDSGYFYRIARTTNSG